MAKSLLLLLQHMLLAFLHFLLALEHPFILLLKAPLHLFEVPGLILGHVSHGRGQAGDFIREIDGLLGLSGEVVEIKTVFEKAAGISFFGKGKGESLLFLIAHDGDGGGVSWRRAQSMCEIGGIMDGLVVDFDDHVAGTESSFFPAAAFFD